MFIFAMIFLLFMDSDFSDFIFPRSFPPADMEKARLSGLSSVFPLCHSHKEVGKEKKGSALAAIS